MTEGQLQGTLMTDTDSSGVIILLSSYLHSQIRYQSFSPCIHMRHDKAKTMGAMAMTADMNSLCRDHLGAVLA